MGNTASACSNANDDDVYLLQFDTSTTFRKWFHFLHVDRLISEDKNIVYADQNFNFIINKCVDSIVSLSTLHLLFSRRRIIRMLIVLAPYGCTSLFTMHSLKLFLIYGIVNFKLGVWFSITRHHPAHGHACTHFGRVI